MGRKILAGVLVCLILAMGVGAFILAVSDGTNQSKLESTSDLNEHVDSTVDLQASSSAAPVDAFLKLLSGNAREAQQALRQISGLWHPGSRVMLVEVLRLNRKPALADQITALLREKTGLPFQRDLDPWYQAIWSDAYQPHPTYVEFKRRLYEQLDPSFAEYFTDADSAEIRLDEICWGGVRRDGIPPLKDPETLPVKRATYLADSDIVFGVEIGGEAHAYPKRILAWHEMVKDVVGGVSINGVYCTLCGSMIVYRTKTPDGKHFELGTSGFLYRSNKLMYDHKTKSMWSTIEGKPVFGPLAGKGIQLDVDSVVTTNWGKWKQQHPDTRVLSLNTGHRRDYSEGAAYRNYFASDQLMYTVPKLDKRLRNKDEVFVIRRTDDSSQPVAMSLNFLRRNPVYHYLDESIDIVIVTDETGANRAYEAKSFEFKKGDGPNQLLDQNGHKWSVNEDRLLPEDDKASLPRIPAHRAFWFGWYSAHPNTVLIQ